MSKTINFKNLLGVGLLVCPLLASAAPNNKVEMSKDEWLGKIKKIVPEPICKGFMEDETIAKRLKNRNIDLKKCMELIPDITDKCQKKFYDRLPDTITQENVSKWGHSIGECIGAEFVIQYVFSGTGSNNGQQDTSNSTKEDKKKAAP